MGFAALYPSDLHSRHCEERSDEAIHLSVMPRYGLLRFARNDDVEALVRQNNPTGKSAKICRDVCAKIFRFPRRANHWFNYARLTRQEGRLAIVTKRAVGCGGREGCD